ncbi:hypothetical protein F0Z19_0578 [Vibrio cyclitrophicus]|nr:hypothetical protein M565_ctg5P0109 [Vibrio cyclitrophicus FF75]KAA8603045.1 hypothetical protein F0Z19_0578 [Vibrio cyclitrophicus]
MELILSQELIKPALIVVFLRTRQWWKSDGEFKAGGLKKLR